jgi:hypothetical protein
MNGNDEGASPIVADIVTGVLGEVDNAVRQAKTQDGSVSLETAAAIEGQALKSLRDKLKAISTHEEAWEALDVKARADLTQRILEFKQDYDGAELWEQSKKHLTSPVELRMLQYIALEKWKSHLEEKQNSKKDTKSVAASVGGIAKLVPEQVRNFLGPENTAAIRKESADFTSAIERSINNDRRTSRALGAILRKK